MRLARIASHRSCTVRGVRVHWLAVKVKANFGSATVRRIAPDSGYVLTPIPLLCVICTSSHRIGDILLSLSPEEKSQWTRLLKPSALCAVGLSLSHCTHAAHAPTQGCIAPTHTPTHLTVGHVGTPAGTGSAFQGLHKYLRSSSLGAHLPASRCIDWTRYQLPRTRASWAASGHSASAIEIGR
jgi:hypothetical protein